MRVELLLLVAVACVAGGVGGMSTCKTVNLEMVRLKRIEAIRSQILSKLRLPKAPEPEESGDEEDIPTDLLSLYNSTKDMLTEQETDLQTPISTEQEEEEYFAKVLHKFNATKTNTTESSKVMYFNISEIRRSVGDHRLLTSAELRMLIRSTTIPTEQRVELYYGGGAGARYHASRFVTNELKDKWLSFDVTEPLRDWLQHSDGEQALHLRVFCDCGQPSSTFSFTISGIDRGRGDQSTLRSITAQMPYILTMSIPQNMSSHLTSRRRRSTDAASGGQTEACSVKSLYIDFRKDLGWKWIHEPKGYFANYCMGSCTYIWNTENKYSQILALYQHHNPGASAQPCCVPQALHSLTIIYYVGRQHKVENLSNMIVSSCKCS